MCSPYLSPPPVHDEEWERHEWVKRNGFDLPSRPRQTYRKYKRGR